MRLTILIKGELQNNISLKQPSLKKTLNYGDQLDHIPCHSIENLFHLFGLKDSSDKDLPVAATNILVDLKEFSTTKEKIWMRADPVFMQADLSSILLFDSQNFSLERSEADELISLINALIKEDDLQLICGKGPVRWYLSLPSHQMISTSTVGVVSGQRVHEFLPRGNDRGFWLRLGNEIQMLLHNCPVNQQRQRRGETPVNGLWFWGAGQLPEKVDCQFDHVLTNDVNASGLSHAAKVSSTELPDDLGSWLNISSKEDEVLMVLSQGDLALSLLDPMKQAEWLDGLEEKVFKPVLEHLKKGRLKSLEIISDDRHCKIHRHHLLRFWRKFL